MMRLDESSIHRPFSDANRRLLEWLRTYRSLQLCWSIDALIMVHSAWIKYTITSMPIIRFKLTPGSASLNAPFPSTERYELPARGITVCLWIKDPYLSNKVGSNFTKDIQTVSISESFLPAAATQRRAVVRYQCHTLNRTRFRRRQLFSMVTLT